MPLLFDHNLSQKLVKRLVDVFPGSTQTRLLGLATAGDSEIWQHAKTNGLTIVTLDADFSDLSVLRGHPPKVIWLRCGNSTVADVEALLRDNTERIHSFEIDAESGCLEIWP